MTGRGDSGGLERGEGESSWLGGCWDGGGGEGLWGGGEGALVWGWGAGRVRGGISDGSALGIFGASSTQSARHS